METNVWPRDGALIYVSHFIAPDISIEMIELALNRQFINVDMYSFCYQLLGISMLLNCRCSPRKLWILYVRRWLLYVSCPCRKHFFFPRILLTFTQFSAEETALICS